MAGLTLGLSVALLAPTWARWQMDNGPAGAGIALMATEAPKARYVEQRQDQFDPSNENSWQQAYYVNSEHWVPGSDAPIFLCVGGEGPAMDGTAVTGSVHCNVAVEWLSEKKALMFALEHRYYGCHNISACPVPKLEGAASLKFLSSRQAVEDVAGFVRAMNAEYGLTDKNKWVTWGGSYPGMMAGWSRLKHPELIHASVASSAPVFAKFDMTEYNDLVANAFSVSDNAVGGGPACEEAIRDGHSKIGAMFKTSEGQAAVELAFQLETGMLNSTDAQASFAGQGVASFPAQGNDPLCVEAACNIKEICNIMTDTTLGDEVARLSQVRKAQLSYGLKQQRVGDAPNELDYWFYQTCTEFGFYQSCNVGSRCFYTQGLSSADGMAKECAQFGISSAQVRANIDATNKHYGALTPWGPSEGSIGSCVMYPNGEVDPWMGLSVLQAPSPQIPVLMVPGASHHAWTHQSDPKDQPSVIAARAAIRTQVDVFLGHECSEGALTNFV